MPALKNPFSILIAARLFFPAATHADDLTSYVDPMIGTASSPTFNTATSVHGGSGNVYPGAVLPFGMVTFGSDTDHPGRLGYSYTDTKLRGFSLTHLSGAGCIVSHELMGYPLIKAGLLTDGPTPFSHTQEKAEPGYYEVQLANGVKAEMTATLRTGFARFQFPPQDNAPHTLSIQTPTNANPTQPQPGSLHVIDPFKIGGWVQGGNFCDLGTKYVVYYAIEFDRPVARTIITLDGATLQFDPANPTPPPLQMKVSISYVSEKNAWLNLSTENPDWIFSELRNAAKSQWNQALEKIAVSGHTASFGTPATNKKILYTALYHSLLHPNVFSDVNGEYLGFDRAPHVTSPPTRIQYANFSGWDIYRTEIQLLAVLFPDRTSDMIQSLLNDANQCGGIPRWAYNNDETGIMVGDPGALLVANAYAFGAEGFDTALALDWLKRDGTDPTRACNGHPTRPGLAEYLKSGYLSDDAGGSGGSAATTLEYNAADFAIARFARTLGDPQTEKTFLAQSTGWKKLYNPSTGYLEPRNQDGSWLKNFTATSNNGFVEGNAAQYTWAAPFDFSDLIQTLGGAAKTVARLDTFFTQLNVGENFPYFWVGDEPTFVTPWIYNWAGAPAHTAEVLQRTLSQNFSTAPGGLPGNDDLGAMSAWYVWAALGLYPTAPGVGGFTVNPPVFGQVELHLDSGHVIRVTSDQKSPGAGAIRALTLDGVAIQKPWVSWAKLEQAKELHFSVISAQQALSLSLSPNWGSQ